MKKARKNKIEHNKFFCEELSFSQNEYFYKFLQNFSSLYTLNLSCQIKLAIFSEIVLPNLVYESILLLFFDDKEHETWKFLEKTPD